MYSPFVATVTNSSQYGTNNKLRNQPGSEKHINYMSNKNNTTRLMAWINTHSI